MEVVTLTMIDSGQPILGSLLRLSESIPDQISGGETGRLQ